MVALQNRPMWVRVGLAVLALGVLLLAVMMGGGYVKAAGYVRDGDALMAEGQYEAAKAAYEQAIHFWPPGRAALDTKIGEAEQQLALATVDVAETPTETAQPPADQPAAADSAKPAAEPATKAKAKTTDTTPAAAPADSTPATTPSDSPSNDSSGSGSSQPSAGESPAPESSSGSGSTPPASGSTTEPVDEPPTPPVLKNLGVAFAPYDSVTGRAGAFDFLSLQGKPFTPFGDNGSEPTFTFLTAEDADVTAVADGYVSAVEYQSTYQDYSILINTEPNNGGYAIDHDHILGPTVSVGDQVSAGKVLGKVGTHSDVGIGRVEIMVFLGGQSITSYCPFTYFDSALRAAYESKLATLMADYESFNHNSGYYDESADDAYATGCLAATLGG